MPSTITGYTTFVADTKARAAEVNANFSNHRGDILPIEEATTTASTNKHDLGSTDHIFKEAHIQAGYWKVGDIKPHHTYNGVVAGPGQGWMLCNGQTINSTNYDLFHSSGDWATYIGSSTLTGLLTPNLTDKYLIGDTVTAQGMTTTVTYTGNSSSAVNLSHSHSIASHNHQWLNFVNSTSADQTYDSVGSIFNIVSGSRPAGTHFVMSVTGGGMTTNGHTDKVAPSTTLSGSTTQSVQPWSFPVQYYIRII